MGAPVDVVLPLVREGDRVTLKCVQKGDLCKLVLTIGAKSTSVTSLPPTDLTTMTAIKIKVDKTDPNPNISIDHTPIDLLNGEFSFTLSGGDLVAGNRQRAYVEFDSGGIIQTSASFFFDVEGVIL
jgi:hypothetical protein